MTLINDWSRRLAAIQLSQSFIDSFLSLFFFCFIFSIIQVVYYNLYFWFRVVCVHLGPCASLVVLNVLLFGALRSAQQKRDKLFKENRKASECRKLRDSNCTTLMLIVVVSCFLVVEIPLAVLTVLHIFDASLELRVLDYDVINVLILFTNFFISLSYPINFAIYCGMSRQVCVVFTFYLLSTPSTASSNTFDQSNFQHHHSRWQTLRHQLFWSIFNFFISVVCFAVQGDLSGPVPAVGIVGP